MINNMVSESGSSVTGRSASPFAPTFNTFRFGLFDLDPAERIISKDNRPLQLSPRAFDVLLVLVDRAPHLVTKTELMSSVWADSFVEEANLAVTISVLRKTLGDADAQDRKFIQTVPKVGYRFVADVIRSDIPQRTLKKPAPAAAADLFLTEPASLPDSLFANNHGQTSILKAKWKLFLSAALGLAAVVGAAASLRLHRPPDNLLSVRSIAVLPFRSNATDTNHSYLGVGVENSIINQLTAGDKLMVPTGNATARVPKNILSNDVAAGRELGVDTVMRGTIEFSPSETRVTTTLTRVSDGQKLWSENFSMSPQQTLDLADVLEEDIATRVSSSVTSAGLGRTTKDGFDTASPEARDLYFSGRYYWSRRTEESVAKSIECFQKAIVASPNFALAYAGLADAYVLSASFSVEPGAVASRAAHTAALTATHLDPGLVEPHASLGMLSFFSDWEGFAAEHEFQRALALKPEYATAHHWYALDLAAMGRLDQATYEIRKAAELDPASLMIGTNVGWVLYLDRRYLEAEQAFQKVLDIDPTFVRAHTRLGITLLAEGKPRPAVFQLEKAVSLSRDPYVMCVLGEALAVSGDRQGAKKILAELINESHKRYVQPFGIALVYIGLGQRPQALEWLQKAHQDRTTSMIWAKVDPELDGLRADPQFQAMLHTMKF